MPTSHGNSSARTKFLPPIPSPRAFRDFYAFEQHVKTCRAHRGLEMPPAWYDAPAFYFSNPNSLVGHEAPVCASKGSVQLDYELELGLVIGRGGKDIKPRDAWKHVAGFTIVNDFSARDLQRNEMSVGLGPAKGKDFATAIGPCLVTPDEIPDVNALKMVARVNGEVWSEGRFGTIHWSFPQMIAHVSRGEKIYPGDLFGSGTVGGGCGLELDRYLQPGDVVELEIQPIGVLKNRAVRAERKP